MMSSRLCDLGRVVPVVTLEKAEFAVPLAKAILSGGLISAEITLRTREALEGIGRIASEVPELCVGAGTVLNASMAKDAVSAGAKFLVSPGLNRNIVRFCRKRQVPLYPGAMTPTEIMCALELGLDQIKFFPAEISGGVAMLKSFAAPFQAVQFIPTGGIHLANLQSYLALSNVMACGGTWLCPQELCEKGDFDGIARLCKEAAEAAKKINC